MHTALAFAVTALLLAAGLRLFLYVDLEDGLTLGLAFCAIYFVITHVYP